MASLVSNDNADAIVQDIGDRLSPFGLIPLGWFDADGQPDLLIGNIGSSL